MDDDIQRHAQAIRESGVLGRSDVLTRLFDFLVVSAERKPTLTEAEIAAELFGRAHAFDPAEDARVRVNVHRLRKKLDQFYANGAGDDPVRLALRKGEYRLTVERAKEKSVAAGSWRERIGSPLGWSAMAFVALNVLAWVLFVTLAGDEDGMGSVRNSPPWASVINDSRPIVVVVGDYYIVGDVDNEAGVDRLVREYDVNSPSDLDTFLMHHPEHLGRYMDLDLYYLPISSAYALRSVLPVIAKGRRKVSVVLASDLTPAMIKDNDIVYVGYLSGLGPLRDPVFAGSRFSVGDTYDELIDSVGRHRYISGSGGPLPAGAGENRETDFGYVSAFEGPIGNKIVIVAGMRDIGLMQAAEALTDGQSLRAIDKRTGHAQSFEALFESEGMRRANLTGRLVLASGLKAERIWTQPKAPPIFPPG